MILSLNRDSWNTVYSKAILTNAINTNENIRGKVIKQCIKENLLVRSLSLKSDIPSLGFHCSPFNNYCLIEYTAQDG